MFNLIKANFYIKPGNGGNGSNACTISTFNKKIYHGGNGGNGGSIIFQYNKSILINNNLICKKIYAENGINGKYGKKDGRNGKDTVILTSQICEINIIEEDINFIINKNNKEFKIKGGIGGLGTRITKDIYTNFSGQKSKTYKVSIKAILPEGIFHILRRYSLNTQEIIKQIFGYKCNINQDIICLEINNKNNYIFFIDVYKSIEILLENIKSIQEIIFYTDYEYDKYNIIPKIIYKGKKLKFSNQFNTRY